MQALDVLDSPLRWETERQNRIHQEAIEQKKKQMRAAEARTEPHPAGHSNQDSHAAFAAAPEAAITLPAEWIDKLSHIPDMRAALIPLDEQTEGGEWSKPFSLCKADIEPWLSFYQGYRTSRLFLQASSPAEGEQDALQLDFPVRALLELKQVDAKIILDPPVQINGLVEYHDLEGELRACRDQVLARTLLKTASDAHEKQLRKALERGCAMGNQLHDALMGEGHGNLIRAWEKVYKRKPTIDELHLMLTTGRIKLSEKRPQPAEPRTSLPQPKPEPVSKETIPEDPDDSVVVNVGRPAQATAKATSPEETTKKAPASEPQSARTRSILIHVVQAVICCAALAALVFVI